MPLNKLQSKQSTLKMVPQLGASGADPNGEQESSPTVLIFEEKPLGMNPRVIPAHVRLFFKLTAKCNSDADLVLAAPVFYPDIERKVSLS